MGRSKASKSVAEGRGQRKVARLSALELLAGKGAPESEDAPPQQAKPKKPTAKPGKGLVKRVRVWWPPTKDKKRTGYGGAYWPATPAGVETKGMLAIEYDNGDKEKVSMQAIFPVDVPVDFGQEAHALQVGEFVEVSNDSKTDPCAWLGVIASTSGKKFKVDYPFHDSPSEMVLPKLLRRARIWEDPHWKFPELGQSWKAGEVTSPLELVLVTEKDYFKQLAKLQAGAKSPKAAAAPKSAGKRKAPAAAAARDVSEPEPSEEPEQPPPKRGRSRKSSHPTRAVLDEGSSGSSEQKPAAKAAGKKAAAKKPAAKAAGKAANARKPSTRRGK